MRGRMIDITLPLIAGAIVLMLAACAAAPDSELTPGDPPVLTMRTVVHSSVGVSSSSRNQ